MKLCRIYPLKILRQSFTQLLESEEMSSLNILLIFLVLNVFIVQNLTQTVQDDVDKVIIFEPSSIEIQIGNSKNVSLRLNRMFNTEIAINFTYGDENKILENTKIIAPLFHIVFPANSTEPQSIQLDSRKVGHLVIGATSNDTDIPLNNVLRLAVIHSNVTKVFIEIIGWIYFVAWSISFYPQIVLNFRMKDVSGLSLDFIAMNFLGFFCYSIFNVCLFWLNSVQKEYFHIHPRGVNPVLINDVFFALHALVLTFVTIIQCIMYKQRTQKISYAASGIIVVLIGVLTISGVICGAHKLSLLDYIYVFSYVKLAITIMKYCPQVYMNFKRKSTVGWSMGNVLLDFIGGSFSLLQMFLLAYNYNDWTSIFGSPTKLGLGLLSIFFDLIFIFQHYVLYRKRENEVIDTANYQPIA